VAIQSFDPLVRISEVGVRDARGQPNPLKPRCRLSGVGVAGAGVDRALPSAPIRFANFAISEVAPSCRRLAATALSPTLTSFAVALSDRPGLAFSSLATRSPLQQRWLAAGPGPMSNFRRGHARSFLAL
jgi:hypothetical protein